MVTDGEYTAVLDRIEDDVAVLLLEQEGEQVPEVLIPQAKVPSDARHQDAVLTIRLSDEQVVSVDYDANETSRRHEAVQSQFDRLADQPPLDDEMDR